MRSLITTCLFLISLAQAFAQPFPISGRINVAPPYPTNLDAYIDFLEQGIIEIENSGSEELDVYFEVLFEETNGLIRIQKDAMLGPSLAISPGLNILTPSEVQDVFGGLTEEDLATGGLSQAQRDAILLNRQIPEGTYRLCIKAFDELGTPLSDPTVDGCTTFEVTFAERPVILSPINNEIVPAIEFLIPLWDQALNNPGAQARTEYILKIIDITEQEISNVQRAMLDPGVSPEYEEEVGIQTTANLQNDIDLPLIIGHQYAARVSAFDPDNIVAYDFGGHSEIVTFWYGSDQAIVAVPAPEITSPKNNSAVENKNSVEIEWEHEVPTNDALAALPYQINFLDVTGKKKKDINELFNNPETEYLLSNTTTSKSELIKLSIQVPLKIGNQYAAQVIYKSPDDLPINIQYENEGKSEIVTFTYGDLNTDFVPDLDPLLANHVQGQISWAFRTSEEENEGGGSALVTTNLGDLSAEKSIIVDNNAKAGKKKYPLKNAQVIIWGQSYFGFTVPIGIGNTKEDGKFAIRLDDTYLHIISNTWLQVIAGGSFESLIKRIRLDQTDFGYLLDPETLAANNMQLAVKVLKEDYQSDTENVAVNLLLQKDNFNAHPHLSQIAPNGGNEVIEYNNDNYVVVHRFEDGDLHKRIFQNDQNFENFVIQVAVQGKPSVFYPQESIFYPIGTKGKKSTPSITKNLIYNVGTEVGGTVYFGEEPRRDARVRMILDSEDVAGAYDPSLQYIRVTDEDGQYNFNNLPNFRNGAEIQIEVIDRTIREKPFIEKFTYDGATPVTKDIILKNEIYTAFGRLLDQYGLPVSNALIQVDSSQTVHSTADGFYMLKLPYPMPWSLKIVADGYDDYNIYPGLAEWYGGFLGEVEAITPTMSDDKKKGQWKKNIEKTTFVKDYIAESQKSEVDAEILGIGFGSLSTRYDTYFAKTETLAGTVGMKPYPMENKQGVAYISASFEGELVAATIEFEGDDNFEKTAQLETGIPYTFSAPDGTISFSITPIEGGPSFVQFFGEIEMASYLNEKVNITLEAGTTVSGVVKDAVTEAPLAEATVKIDGLDFNATADEEGKYTLYLPVNDEYTFIGKKSKYNRRDTAFLVQDEPITFDFLLEPRDSSLPDFTTIAGFPVILDFVEKADEGFMVSGELTLGENDLFAPGKGEEVLEFREIIVETNDDNEEDGTPSQNFYFETTELNITAFDFAPVTVSGGPRIELRMLEGAEDDSEVNSKAVIGGTELSLELEANPTFSAFPFSFPNATMKNAEREDYLEDKLEELGFDISGSTPEEIAEKTETAGTVAGALFEELNFERVFVSPDAKIKEISEDVEYNLTYDEPDFESNQNFGPARPDDGGKYDGFKVSKFAMTKLLIADDKSTLTKDGINMEGALEMPKMIGAKMNLKDNRILIDKLSIGKNFNINELTFQVSPNKPIKGNLKTWELRLNTLSLYGLGTKNMGMGFGGDVRLKKDTKVTGQDSSHLVINSFNIINKEEEGVTVSADLSFKPKGLQVGPLKISQEEGKNVELSLSRKDWAFEIKASNLKLETTSTNAISKKIFPLEILQFNMKSKDWSVLVAMKPNLKFDFGVMKVQVSKFLLNYGYDMGMDEMNELLKMSDEEREEFFNTSQNNSSGMSAADAEYLRSKIKAREKIGASVPKETRDAVASYDRDVKEMANKFGTGSDKLTAADIEILKSEIAKKEAAGTTVPASYSNAVRDYENKQAINGGAVSSMNEIGGDELLDEDNINWAIGIAGGVQFPIKGMDTRIHASVLLARNNDAFDFRINEILLQMEQPSFKLKIAAELSLGGQKVGFSGEAEMETLKKKFAAGFKFFKYSNSNNFEIGAKLVASTKIVTGPVLWHKIGGGFDFNTYTKRYKVFVTGSAGPIGVPQQVTSIDDAYVSILFDLNKCRYQPIVEGSAKFVVKRKQYGDIKARLDFCKYSAYLDISNTMELAAGLVTARIGGTIYVMKDGSQGRMFMGLNAKITDKFGIFKGNGLVGIGVNFKKTSSTPYAIANTYRGLPSIAKKGGRFNGLILSIDMSVPQKNGKFGISIGSFDLASFKYHAGAKANAYVFKSFDRSDFEVVGKLDANAGGSLRFLGMTLIGGSAYAKLNIKGGYQNVWYFSANGNLRLEVYNKKSYRCNRITVGTFKECINVHYPCGPWWCAGLCEWCYCCRKCITLPKLIPDFKTCFNASFSISTRQGRGTKVSFSTN